MNQDTVRGWLYGLEDVAGEDMGREVRRTQERLVAGVLWSEQGVSSRLDLERLLTSCGLDRSDVPHLWKCVR